MYKFTSIAIFSFFSLNFLTILWNIFGVLYFNQSFNIQNVFNFVIVNVLLYAITEWENYKFLYLKKDGK